MGTLFVDKLDPQSGTALEIGSSGDTMTVPSGATLSIAGTINASSGTATGFGETNTPLWKLWRSGSQSMSTGADTKIPFNTWSLDPDNVRDLSNNRVVPGVAGKYFIVAQVRMDTSTNFNMFYIDIRIDGSKKTEAQVYHDQTGTVTTSLVVDLSATNYIESYAMQNSGGSLNMMGGEQNTWIQGFLIAS